MDRAGRAGPGGFTLIEAVVSMLILGGLGVAVMSTVGAAGASRKQVVERSRAQALATDLLSEILSKAYADPEVGLGVIGRDAGEAADRSQFDDVDDYHGWAETPPKEIDGNAIAWATGLTRSVRVNWVTPGSLNGTSGTGTWLKRVEVVVSRSGKTLAKATGLRAYAFDLSNLTLDEALVKELEP